MTQEVSLTQLTLERVAASSPPTRESVGTCRHRALVAAAVPDAAKCDTGIPAWSAEHAACPACECPITVRFLHPAAGGCMMWIEERWLAGRTWAYRRVADRWEASI